VLTLDTTKELVTSACYDKQRVCDCFYARRANSGKTLLGATSFYFLRAQASLNLGGLEIGLLKSSFNAKNCICRLSWSISSHFGAIRS